MRHSHVDGGSRRQDLFAARQIYLRSGTTSRYVNLSRSLQIAVTALAAVLALWLGAASYIAIAKHLQTVEQGRELARLEGIAQALRSAVEEAQEDQRPAGGAEANAEVVTELAEVRLGRARATLLAEAAAGEAATLRREVALASERIRELELDLVRATLEQEPRTRLVGNAAAGTGISAGPLAQVACEVPWADARR